MRHQWATSDAQILRMERQGEPTTSAAVCSLERRRQDAAIRTTLVYHDCANLFDNLNVNVMRLDLRSVCTDRYKKRPPASTRCRVDTLAARRAWRPLLAVAP